MTDIKKRGRPQDYNDDDFINVLTDQPQTTAQVQEKLRQNDRYKKITMDSMRRILHRLANDGIKQDEKIIFPVIRTEIPAGTGTGKMYLWMKKKEQETEHK